MPTPPPTRVLPEAGLRSVLLLGAIAVLGGCKMSAHESVNEWSRYSAELEGGLLWQARNEVAAPGETGARFSLRDLLGEGPDGYARVGVGYDLNEVHRVRLLWAPIEINGSGELAAPTSFAGTNFAAGETTSGRYQLDSFQLTWAARVHAGEVWTWRAGVAGRYLDGSVDLAQGELQAEATEAGLLPLLHLDGVAQMSPRWSFVFDGDAGGMDQRRLIDVSLQVRAAVDEDWSIGFGYRGTEAYFEGPEIYNFPWFHAALVSIGYRL